MLEKIRKSADNIFIRIFLGLIAFSFVVAGGNFLFAGGGGRDVVKFSKVKSISVEDFRIAKAREIDALQRQNGITLTDENIAELNLDAIVLRRLMRESMMSYLAECYDFDISEDLIIKIIQKSPYFNNEKGEFDIKIFKSAFGNSQQKEDEHIQAIKSNMIRASLFDVFMESFTPNKFMIDNIVNYMAEKRVVDLFSVDLGYKPSGYKAEKLTQEQLESFYNQNQEAFVVPELRSFDYVKVDSKFLAAKLNISEAEMQKYFKENKAEFSEKDFQKARKQVREALAGEKLDVLANELARSFEEDIASGLTLTEIAKKYQLQISSKKDMSVQQMSESSNKDLIELTDSVFEMIEGEVSYPIEVASTHEILLVNLKSVIPSRQKPFAEVQNDIQTLLEKRMLAMYNVKQLEEVVKNYNPNTANAEQLKSKGVNLIVNRSFIRDELLMEEKIPGEVLQSIFEVDKGKTTILAENGGRVYGAYLRDLGRNESKAKSIAEDSSERFGAVIKDGLFQELTVYLMDQNKMQVIEF
jgi:hypothetical protein